MLDCQTLVCLGNQMPSMGMDDLLVIGYLAGGLIIVVYLIIDALKGK